jgi:gamma-glutamylcyclotransferase (GGCT)/AIG2-like uncharacterized protein YtfP
MQNDNATYLFAYGTLLEEGDVEGINYTSFNLNKFLKEEGSGTLMGIAHLYRVEAVNKFGDHIVHPALCFNVDPTSHAVVKGRLYRIDAPAGVSDKAAIDAFREEVFAVDETKYTGKTHVAKEAELFEKISTVEELFVFLDKIEDYRNVYTIYSEDNYFYRSLVPIVVGNKVYNAYTYILNPFSKRLKTNGGKTEVLSMILSGDWVEYCAKKLGES